ncbi:Splicing factor YJU2, partial [Galemys pyrenaicus]
IDPENKGYTMEGRVTQNFQTEKFLEEKTVQKEQDGEELNNHIKVLKKQTKGFRLELEVLENLQKIKWQAMQHTLSKEEWQEQEEDERETVASICDYRTRLALFSPLSKLWIPAGCLPVWHELQALDEETRKQIAGRLTQMRMLLFRPTLISILAQSHCHPGADSKGQEEGRELEEYKPQSGASHALRLHHNTQQGQAEHTPGSMKNEVADPVPQMSMTFSLSNWVHIHTAKTAGTANEALPSLEPFLVTKATNPAPAG